MAYSRKYRRYYRKKYSKARRYKSLSVRSTKAFTVTLRNTTSLAFAVEAGTNLSAVKCFSAYNSTHSNVAALNNTLFSRFTQLFGEFKINSLRIKITPNNNINQPVTIYTVADRKFLQAETLPSANTVANSMTAVANTYTSASTARVKRLMYAYSMTEKSTYIDCTIPTGSVTVGTPFLPAFYVCAFVGTAATDISIPVTVEVIASVTFRNPLY